MQGRKLWLGESVNTESTIQEHVNGHENSTGIQDGDFLERYYMKVYRNIVLAIGVITYRIATFFNQWRIQRRGAQQAPPKIVSVMFILSHFVSECLKISLR